MNRIAGNDMIEMWGYEANGAPHICWHDRQALDQRAKLLVDLVKMWGHSAPMVEAMREHEDSAPHKRHAPPDSIADVVLRAAETVEAIWFEAQRRGWLIDLPPYDEVLK